MTGRKPMPPGTWGNINVTQKPNGTYQAEARFAAFSGESRKVRATGPTKSAARSALILDLKERRSAEGSDSITPQTTVSELAEFWLDEKEREGVSAGTMRFYRGVVNRVVIPAMGARRIGDCPTSALDALIKRHGDGGGSTKHLKTVLNQMFHLAARHDAIMGNPVQNTARLKHRKIEVRSLSVVQVREIQMMVLEFEQKKRPGPPTSNDLRHIVDLILATGARIGEMAALMWSDVDLVAAVPTITISGTIVTETGKGTYRQPRPKTDAGYRTIPIPPFAVDILMQRRVDSTGNDLDAVFCTRNGTWHQISNLERRWNQIVDDTPYDWVTFHTFRKTVATMIDSVTDAKTAAAVLGHSSEQITLEHYISKPAIAPDVTSHLERFRPHTTV